MNIFGQQFKTGLRFKDSETEEDFRQSLHNPGQFRMIIMIAAVLFTAYLPLDHILFGVLFKYFLIIRLGVFLPYTMLAYILSYSIFFRNHPLVLVISSVLTASGCVIAMEYLSRESQYAGLYYYGITQILIFFFGTGKISVKPALITGLAVVIPAIIVDSLFVVDDPLRSLMKSIYLVTMLLIGTLTTAIIQEANRRNYLNHKRVEELSLTDHLTGLKNRLFFDSIIKPEIIDFVKYTGPPGTLQVQRTADSCANGCYAVFLLDLDHFKKVNDTYGHDTGDLVLQEFSERVKAVIRSNDILIRWGGEEFMLILRHTREEFIKDFVKRIRAKVSDVPFKAGDKNIRVTISGGLFTAHPHSAADFSEVENIISLADSALYYSKENGRNMFTSARCSNPAGGEAEELIIIE